VIGIDIGKDVFHRVGFCDDGKIASLARSNGSQTLRRLGRRSRMTPAICATPFVNDTENAIPEAAQRRSLTFFVEPRSTAYAEIGVRKDAKSEERSMAVSIAVPVVPMFIFSPMGRLDVRIHSVRNCGLRDRRHRLSAARRNGTETECAKEQRDCQKTDSGHVGLLSWDSNARRGDSVPCGPA
jgi:hypothetical protein